MKCTECQQQTKSGRVTKSHHVGDRRIDVEVPAKVCACGESFIQGQVAARADLQVAAELARCGALDGATLRFQRKSLGLTAKRLADLLGLSASHLSHIENGKQPVPRLAAVLVGRMVLDRVDGAERTAELLGAVDHPTTPKSLKIRATV